MQQVIIAEEFDKRPGLIRPSLEHRGVDPADDPRQGNRRAARAVRLADAARHPALVPAVQRTRRRLGPGIAESPARRRSTAAGWSTVTRSGPRRRIVAAVRGDAGAHRSRRAEAPRDQLLPDRHVLTRHRGLTDQASQRPLRLQRMSSSPTCSCPTRCWSASPGDGWELAVATMAVERTAIGNYVNIDRVGGAAAHGRRRGARPRRDAARPGDDRGPHHRDQSHGAARDPASGGGAGRRARRRASPSTRW